MAVARCLFVWVWDDSSATAKFCDQEVVFVVDSDVVQPGSAVVRAAVANGGEFGSVGRGRHEVDVHPLGNGDGGSIAVGIIARPGEDRIGKREDHAAVGDLEAVEHVLSELHVAFGVSVTIFGDRNAEPFGSPVVTELRMVIRAKVTLSDGGRSVSCRDGSLERLGHNESPVSTCTIIY